MDLPVTVDAPAKLTLSLRITGVRDDGYHLVDAGLASAQAAARAGAKVVLAACNAADLERFLGCYLTEPKSNVVFSRPRRPAAPGEFARRAAREGLRLALPTRMLYRRGVFFINGEACGPDRRAGRTLRQLADRRLLPPATAIDRDSARWLYQWYRAGYLEPGA